ncbi:MAG: M20/M25/M40 family metallo-hydrolase [Vicingaceae bacterium]
MIVIRHIFLSVFFSLSAFGLFSQDNAESIKQIRKDVEYLASDNLKGREAGTKEERKAAAYIAKRFEKIGLTPLGDDGDYLQEFSFPKVRDPHTGVESEERSEGVNVVGYIDNSAQYNVIIGAHFDHLGMGGGPNSLHTEKAVHNGADDNASGVAAMLYMAEVLKSSKFKRNNYIFIAFTGEEKGLYGSNYFLKHPPFYLTTMNYMINFDMVGRLDSNNKVVINAVGTSPIWKTTLQRADTSKLRFTTSESGVGPSDHTSFYLKDIPAIHFFTGAHEDYHRPSDDADKVNMEGIAIISDFALGLVADLNAKLKLAFTRTKDEDNTSSTRPRYKVSLGVVPDYLYDGEGMRIDGIKQDRPASNAGIRAGDVVISIGDVKVTNMKTYMDALKSLEEGQKAVVTIKRGEKPLDFDVQF